MGAIYDAIMTQAKATATIMFTPTPSKSEHSIDVDAEIQKLDAQATAMQEAAMDLIETKYDALTKALPASIPVRIGKYRLERFQSDDKEQFGENGVKLSFNEILAKVNKDIDEEIKEMQEKAEKDLKEKAEKHSKERIAKEKAKEAKRKAENKKRDIEAKIKLAKEHKDDLLLRAHSLAKMAEHNVDDFEKTKKEAYQEEESKVDGEAKLAGYAKGAEDVKKYNEAMVKTAKGIVDKIRKAEAKIEILKKKVTQTVKLKLGAKLGL